MTEADDSRLIDGFHGFEPEPAFRWTDGGAGLPSALLDGWRGPSQIVVMLGETTQHPKAAVRALVA